MGLGVDGPVQIYTAVIFDALFGSRRQGVVEDHMREAIAENGSDFAAIYLRRIGEDISDRNAITFFEAVELGNCMCSIRRQAHAGCGVEGGVGDGDCVIHCGLQVEATQTTIRSRMVSPTTQFLMK